jgi:hypothetical protein
MTMIKTLSLCGFLALAGCSMVSKGKEVETGGGDTGGGEEPAAAGFADNMHDAPMFSQGDSLTANLECHASGYLKVDASAGTPLQIQVTVEPEGACYNLEWMNSNGGSQNGGQMFGEVCESKTFDVTGLEGGAFIQISESGVCKNASVTLALQ